MKKLNSKLLMALAFTFITGTYMAQGQEKPDTTKKPVPDTTKPPVPDTTKPAEPDTTKPESPQSAALESIIKKSAVNNYAQGKNFILTATNHELLNSKKYQLKEVDKQES